MRVLNGPRLLLRDRPPTAVGAGLVWASRAESMTVLATLDDARVTGRGGAGFPAARKWRSALSHPGPRVVVVNAGEHEPGSLKDAVLLRDHTDLVIEGAAIAGSVLQAQKITVVVDGGREELVEIVGETIKNWSGALGNLPIPDVVTAPHDYLVGEETALLEVVEGRVPKPRFKPPLPVERGYFGYPTVVHNVETLANVAWVCRQAAEGSASLPASTFLWTVWSPDMVPVVGECSEEQTVLGILHEAGVEDFRGVTIGGYSGGVLCRSEASVPVTRTSLVELGLSLGCGSFRVIAEDECFGAVAHEIVDFFARASCGQCVPCQQGLMHAAEMLGGRPTKMVANVAEAVALVEAVLGRGVCRLPDGAALTLRSLWRLAGEEIEAHAAGGACRCTAA